MCPECGRELYLEELNEVHGEEYLCYGVCPGCGYVDKYYSVDEEYLVECFNRVRLIKSSMLREGGISCCILSTYLIEEVKCVEEEKGYVFVCLLRCQGCERVIEERLDFYDLLECVNEWRKLTKEES